MGTRIGFFDLLALQRRTVETWQFTAADPAATVQIAMGRLTVDHPAGTWFVSVNRRGIEPLICRDEDEARADRHTEAVSLMAACGPGRWSQVS